MFFGSMLEGIGSSYGLFEEMYHWKGSAQLNLMNKTKN